MALIVACAALVAAGTLRSESAAAPPPPLPSAASLPVPIAPAPSDSPAPDLSASSPPVESSPLVATSGDGTLVYADGQGAVAGRSGTLRRYRVAVEGGIGIDANEFAGAVDEVLADPRSWTASGNLRLQRVSSASAFDFTVVLASPVTSERLCRAEGLETEQYTNCRLRGKVVLNSARWLTGVPDYGAPLATYQAYAVNHEVGHELGQWHELCPGPGQPAPVMQQQTLGLQGCVANSWPYLNGVRYRGPTADD